MMVMNKTAGAAHTLQERLALLKKRVKEPSLRAQGRLLRMRGLSLEVVGIEEEIGARCLVIGKMAKWWIVKWLLLREI